MDYLTNFYKTYFQNLKYNVKRTCIFHLILVGILSILIMFVKKKKSVKKDFYWQSFIWRFRQNLCKFFCFFPSPSSCTIFVFLFILALCWQITWPIWFYFLFFVNVAWFFFVSYNNLTNQNTRRYFMNLTENLLN